MPYPITYPTSGDTSPTESAASSGRGGEGSWVGRGLSHRGIRVLWQSLLGIEHIKDVPAVGRQREEGMGGVGGFTLHGFPTGMMDASPTCLWKRCDLTHSLKITVNTQYVTSGKGLLLSAWFNWCNTHTHTRTLFVFLVLNIDYLISGCLHKKQRETLV